MTERRKQQLRMEGLDPDKIEAQADKIIKGMTAAGLTVREAELVIKIVDGALKESEKHRPDTKLSDIAIQNR